MSIDLSTQKELRIDPENQKGVLELIDPRTGDPLQDDEGNIAKLHVYGPDSTVYKSFNRKVITKNLSKRSKNGSDIKESDVEEGEKTRLERCVAVVFDWENLAYDGNEDCTPENRRKMFTAAPWIVEQLEGYIHERANFMKG